MFVFAVSDFGFQQVGCQNGKGGIEKGCVKLQSPSVQNQYENPCCFLIPPFPNRPFCFLESGCPTAHKPSYL